VYKNSAKGCSSMNNPKPITPQATSSMVLRRSQRGQLL
jgi:hypothetical protein